MTSRNNYYNKRLKGLARGMRNKSTKAEIRLWCELLRGKSLRGYGFLRQRSMGNYIVDFFSKELKLVIEVDGPDHDFKVKADLKKDIYLKDIGLHLIRIKDEDVIDNISIVKQILEGFIDDFESSTSTI